MDHNILSLTVSPSLDMALAKEWDAFLAALNAEDPVKLTQWWQGRLGRDVPSVSFSSQLTDLLANDPESRAIAAVELAELAEGVDDSLAEMLWEGALRSGLETGDGDLLFEATEHLAHYAKEAGDALAVGEYYVDFLNWRRQGEHASDPEVVHVAFEEIIQAAELDEQPGVAARFTYEQARFQRVVDRDADSAAVGDWIPGDQEFVAWGD